MDAFEEPRFPWLEIALGFSVLALVFQIFPDLWATFLVVLDFRQWTWTVWTGINAAVVAILIYIRAWRNR